MSLGSALLRYITYARHWIGGPGIRGTQVKSSVQMKNRSIHLNDYFGQFDSGNQRPQISLVTSHSNELALNPIGGIFLLEPLHPRYLGWMILLECHESPAG